MTTMAGDARETPRHGPLRVRDGIALTVGVVVGIGVFRSPSLVALRIDDPLLILGLWAAGALIMFVGALCYAELGSACPDAGGEYHFLSRAYGPVVAFLFGWGRLAVVQTGAIAAVAFVLGDYAQRLANLGPYGPSIYAALGVAGIAFLNMRGTRLSAGLQSVLAAVLVGTIFIAAVAGLLSGAPQPEIAPEAAGATEGSMWSAIGFAMIFVMLTYGGWNEAAYLSGELRDVRRNMLRTLAAATAIVTMLYLTINAAYLYVLGPDGVRGSDAVGADYMRVLLGPGGEIALAALVVLGALTTLNATVFTGARSMYAMGRDNALLGILGRWNTRAEGPVSAHLVQAALALALIGVGTATRQGFTTMVEYTAPVFWFFLLLTGASLIVLRRRGGLPEDSFRTPLHPLMPLLFCATSGFMLHASLVYTGVGALFGASVLTLGVPLWFAAKRAAARAQAAEARGS